MPARRAPRVPQDRRRPCCAPPAPLLRTSRDPPVFYALSQHFRRNWAPPPALPAAMGSIVLKARASEFQRRAERVATCQMGPCRKKTASRALWQDGALVDGVSRSSAVSATSETSRARKPVCPALLEVIRMQTAALPARSVQVGPSAGPGPPIPDCATLAHLQTAQD